MNKFFLLKTKMYFKINNKIKFINKTNNFNYIKNKRQLLNHKIKAILMDFNKKKMIYLILVLIKIMVHKYNKKIIHSIFRLVL